MSQRPTRTRTRKTFANEKIKYSRSARLGSRRHVCLAYFTDSKRRGSPCRPPSERGPQREHKRRECAAHQRKRWTILGAFSGARGLENGPDLRPAFLAASLLAALMQTFRLRHSAHVLRRCFLRHSWAGWRSAEAHLWKLVHGFNHLRAHKLSHSR